jgi:hypothetical protein
MPSPSKNKGSGFEREVAKYLSELYGESFIRAPGSGAYVGGKNQSRTQILHEGQIRSFKGDIVPGQSFPKMNVECKFYSDFSFHLLLTGEHKTLDSWLEQLTDVAEDNDLNLLFMKFNRIGRYVAVECKHTWVTDNFFFYGSKKHGDWYIMEFDSFMQQNKDLVKAYSKAEENSTDKKSLLTINTNSNTILA